MGAAPEPQTGNKMELRYSTSPALPPRHFLRHWLRAFAAKVASVAGVLLRPLGPRERHCGGRRLPVELLHETVHWAPFEQCARLAFGAGCAPLAALADARHKKLAALKMAAVLRRKRGERELLRTRFGGPDKHAQCWCRPAGVKPSPMEMAINEFLFWEKELSPNTIGHCDARLHIIKGQMNFLAFGNFEASGYFNTGGQPVCRVQCPLTLVTASAHSIAFWECREPKKWHALAVLEVEPKLGVKYDQHYAEIRWKRKPGLIGKRKVKARLFGEDGWHETGDVQRRRLWTQVRFRPLLRNDFDALLALFQTQLAVPKISHCNEAYFGDPLLLPPVHVHRNYALEDDVVPHLQQHPITSHAQSSAPHLQLHPSTSQAQSSAAGGGLPAIGGGQIQPDGYDGKVLYEVVVVPSDATAVHFSRTKMTSAAPSTRQCGEKGATEEEEDQWHDALTDVPGPLRGLVTGAAGQIGYSLNSKSEQTTKKQNESVTSPSAASTAKSPSEDTTPFHRVDSGDKKHKEEGEEPTTSFHCAAATPPIQQAPLEPAPAHVLEEEAPPSPPTAPKLADKDQQGDEQKMEEQFKGSEEEAKAEEAKNEGKKEKNEGKKDEEKSAEGKDEIAEAKKGEEAGGEVDVEQDGKSAEEEKVAEEQN